MMESTGKYIARKISEAGSILYRSLVFPFVKMGIERRTNSIICKGVYLNKGTTLAGRNYIGSRAELSNVSLGYSSFISPCAVISNAEVGKYSCIGDIKTISGRHPVKGENVSIYPAFYSTAKQFGYTYVSEDSYSERRFTDPEKGYNISIGNDVWIGFGVMITDGVRIGDGAVVGTRSLVTGDIESYAIYAGTPAKKIGQRFDDDTIAKLLELKWWDKDEAWLMEHAASFKNPGEFIKEVTQDAT